MRLRCTRTPPQERLQLPPRSRLFSRKEKRHSELMKRLGVTRIELPRAPQRHLGSREIARLAQEAPPASVGRGETGF